MNTLETIIAEIIKLQPVDHLLQTFDDARAGDRAAIRYLRTVYRHVHPVPDDDNAAMYHAERMAEYAAENAESWAYADNNPD